MLQIIKVGWNSHHRFTHHPPQKWFSRILLFPQYHRSNLGWRVFLPLGFYPQIGCIRRLANFLGDQFGNIGDFRVVIGTANETFDRTIGCCWGWWLLDDRLPFLPSEFHLRRRPRRREWFVPLENFWWLVDCGLPTLYDSWIVHIIIII